MRGKCILGIIISSLLLSACQPMPDEVTKNMERYNKSREISEKEMNTTYIAFADLKSDVTNALSDRYQNFVYPTYISTTYPDAINIPAFRIINSFSEQTDDVMCDFWGKDIWQQEKVFLNENVLLDENGGYYAAVMDRGFVCQIKPSAFTDMFENPGICIADIHPSTDLLPTDTYSLIGGKYTASQALDYINTWLNTIWVKYEPGFSFEVSELKIYRTKNNLCYFTFDILQLYQGIPLDDMAFMPLVENENGSSVCKYTTAKKYIKMYECDSIDLFTNSTGIVTLASQGDALAECYSLHTGLKQIEQEFSGFQDILVNDIKLKYMLQPVYDPDTGENFNSPGIQIITKPVWCIYVDGKTESNMAQNLNTQKFINIDVQSGELEYQLE